jgi:DnaK suppressor protein
MVGRMDQTETVARTLADRRARLEEQMAQMTAPPTDMGSISFGKRIGEGTSQAVDRLAAVPAHDKLQTMLVELKRAQDKLAEGTYGRCDICGAEIAAERLEARPWSTRCVRDAALR